MAKILSAMVEALKDESSIRRVILFGSAAWGELGKAGDIDLAVEGLDPSRFLQVWLRVEAKAEGLPFDLVPLSEAPPLLRRAIEDEGVVLYERLGPTRS